MALHPRSTSHNKKKKAKRVLLGSLRATGKPPAKDAAFRVFLDRSAVDSVNPAAELKRLRKELKELQKRLAKIQSGRTTRR